MATANPIAVPGQNAIVPYANLISNEIKSPIAALGAASATPGVPTLTPQAAKANWDAEKAAKTAAAAQAAAGPQPLSSIGSLLAAILGGQQGQIPQGYANLFTNVVGPMQGQLANQFSQQLAGIGGEAPHIAGVDKTTQDAINKAYGETGAQLNALNQAAMTGSGLGAQAEQQFVTGPLANTQKLIQSLQAALSYLPYVQATTGASPLTQAIEQMLGLGTTGAINPAGATTPQTAPSISG
jgi:hypothetical protein